MGFFSNDNFKNIRKIFYIVAIFSMLLSIKSKVFGATIPVNVRGGELTLPSWIDNSTYNYYIFQEPTETTDVYKWAIFVTRGNSYLQEGTQNNNFYQGKTWTTSPYGSNYGLVCGYNNSPYYTFFTGTLTDYQTRINSWTTNNAWQTAFWQNSTDMNTISLDFYNSYIYCSKDILKENGDVLIETGFYIPPSLQSNPSFDNPQSEIETLDFDSLFVNPNGYGIENTLYLKILEVTNVIEDTNDVSNNIYYYNDLTFSLNNKSKYLTEFFDTGTYYYSIPYSALKLKKDKSYYFILTSSGTQINQTQGEITTDENIFDVILVDTQNLVTTSDEILQSIINNNPSDNTNNEINNNLPRPSYDNSDLDINIPGMNVNIPNDVTANGFNYLFNMIYTQINPTNNTDSAQDIVFNIPFVNKELRINKDFTRNLLGNNSPIITLLSTIYYFIVSYYILQDIRKTIEKINTGDIMTHTDTNIKADML